MKKSKNTTKNFCDLCGLKIISKEYSNGDKKQNEKFFENIANLGFRKKGRFARHISDSNDSSPDLNFVEFCAIGSRKWIKNGIRCKDFHLKLPTMVLSDSIAIYTAEKIARSQNKLIWIGIIVSILGLFFVLFGAEIKKIILCSIG